MSTFASDQAKRKEDHGGVCSNSCACFVSSHASGYNTDVLAFIGDDDLINVIAPSTTHDELKSIPGAKFYYQDSLWRLPLNWASCITLRGVFGHRLKLGQNLKTWAIDYKEDFVDPAMALRDAPDFDFREYDEEFKLYPYQRSAAEFLRLNKFALNGDDMRVGKTPTVIRALRAMHEDGEDVFPAVVICPNNVKRVWIQKFKEFWPDVDVQVPKSGIAAAEKAIAATTQVLVLHYEILPLVSRLHPYGAEALKACKECSPEVTRDGVTVPNTLQPSKCHVHLKAMNHIQWKSVIADEVHRITEPTAQMTRAIWQISRGANVRFGLTGTPPEDPDRHWCLMNFIMPDEYPTKGRFRDRYVNAEVNPWSGFLESKGWKQERRDELDKFFLPRFIRRPKTVVHNFIAADREVIEPEMTPKQAKAYKDLKLTMLAEIDGGVFWVDNPAVKMTRLRQLASAYGEVDDDNNFTLTEPSHKLDALQELLKGLDPNDSVVIFAEQAQLIELAATRMGDKAVKLVGGMSETARADAERRFQDGEVKYILCTTSTGGEGISLNRADTLVFLQRPFSRQSVKQAEDRIYTEGRTSLIIDIQTPDTVEEKVLKTLAEKDVKFEDLVRDEDTVRRWLA